MSLVMTCLAPFFALACIDLGFGLEDNGMDNGHHGEFSSSVPMTHPETAYHYLFMRERNTTRA